MSLCPPASFYSLLVGKVKIICKSSQDGMCKPGMAIACAYVEGSGQGVAQLFTKCFSSGPAKNPSPLQRGTGRGKVAGFPFLSSTICGTSEAAHKGLRC